MLEHEDGYQWFKSSYSGGSGTECVQTTFVNDGAAVRDSKQPEQGQSRVRASTWGDFVRSVRQGGLW
ncbi:DUF397 domain-containing protein [Streptomyces sp. NBC_00727]|uniref:DUF397 domain-containing protein n=1 Tax=Streptomyces sp. NBC_00727 TaxID=2903675 RepID=UPI00386FF84F